jgi:hypothetical protein
MVKVWAQPHVEDFIRSLGTGEKVDIQTLGRFWQSPGQKLGEKLFVYDMNKAFAPIRCEGEEPLYFQLDRPGTELLIDNVVGKRIMLGDEDDGYRGPSKPQECVNLSFLRLCGISNGGVTFIIRGVYTREEITALGEKFERATKKFYREFLKPFKLIITVSTMPING